MKKFLFLIALFTLMGGANSVKAETIVTKTPVILTGSIDGCNPGPCTYGIQMQGWQQFIAYEDATGVSFDEDSYMQFELEETCSNTEVRVTFRFDDGTELERWWCLGIGESADDKSTPYYHVFDESKYWLKKGLGADFETKKSLKITKVVVKNFNYDSGNSIVTYKVNGGIFCDTPMTIKNDNTKTFGILSGTFSPTAAQKNIFKMENFVVGDYQKLVIEFGSATPSGWAIVTAGGYPPNLETGITKKEIALSGANLSEFSIFNWDANPDPIKISEVYLYKEEDTDVLLNFDEFGFARSSKKDLVAADGLSYDPETGVLTSDGTAGTLTLEFSTPQDLLDLNIFDVRRSGNDNIVNRLKFYDEDDKEINTWNGARLYNSGLDGNATRAFKNNKAVKKLVWESDEEAAKSSMTLTITEIQWQLKTISAMKGTSITSLPYKAWDNDGDNDANVTGDASPATNFNMLTDDVVYGQQNIGDSKHYVDLTNYQKLIIRGYGTIRLFYNWHQSTGGTDPEAKPIDAASFVNGTGEVKTMELDIPTFMTNNSCSHFHLIGVKGSGKCYVESISVLDGTEKYDYAISGKGGLKLQSTVDALADVKATAIDASALTNAEEFKVTLTPANPNCLIKVNSDQLDNESNVIVGSTCANLVLTDGYPFKAPENFTADAASYSTTINAAGAGTLCLPFAATIPGGVTAYTLTYSNGADKAVATPVETTIPANTPVLLNGSGAAEFTGSGAVSASATNVRDALTGVFEATTVPENSYVLQKGTSGLGFYRVESGDIVANPFRAYLTALLGARTIGITYGGVTNINEVKANKVGEKDVYYNLNGQRVSNPTKGVFIKNGVKVSF